jgi:hypothetical protein
MIKWNQVKRLIKKRIAPITRSGDILGMLSMFLSSIHSPKMINTSGRRYTPHPIPWLRILTHQPVTDPELCVKRLTKVRVPITIKIIAKISILR